jgi:hypothetical protein
MIQYVHNPGYKFPYHFVMPRWGDANLKLQWLTARSEPGFIDGEGPAAAPDHAMWWYNGITIGIKDHDVAMEFRLRWC